MTVRNFLTIDFEDWYQGLTSTSRRPEEWPSFEKRISIGADWLLETFAKAETKATFFIVGQVAQEHANLVRRIADAGHEIGLHGHRHRLIYAMGPQAFIDDVNQNYETVQEAAGCRPIGFRAPCFSVTEDTPWVWPELARLGLRFDSSVFPIRTPLYGMPNAPRLPYAISTTQGIVLEIPVSTVEVGPLRLPFSGGFYFRSLPYWLTRSLTRHLNRHGQPVVFYFHPWEFDPEHPRPPGVTARERLSHYGFLKGARSKLLRLLSDFPMGPLGAAVR